MTVRNITATPANDQQSTPEYVQHEHDREQAAAVIRIAFPARLKRWNQARFGLSRARNGSTDSPLFRLRVWLRGGRKAGMTRDQAMMVVTDLLAVIEAEWGEPVSFEDASRDESVHDGTEDVEQIASLIDRRHLPGFVVSAKQHVASQLITIASAERDIARRA